MTNAIYMIKNSMNGKFYVGGTTELKKRMYRHSTDLFKNKHHSIEMQKDFNMYTDYVFELHILEYVQDKNEVVKREQFHIDRYLKDSPELLYNIGMKSNGGDNLTHHPNREQIIQKIQKSIRDKNKSMSIEQRKILYGQPGKRNGMYGKTHSAETRKKISDHNKGQPGPWLGKTFSIEHRRKMSENASKRIGNKNAFYGKVHSPDTRKRISDANKGRLPINTQKVEIDGVIYNSKSEAGRTLNVATATISNRCNNNKFPTYKTLDNINA